MSWAKGRVGLANQVLKNTSNFALLSVQIENDITWTVHLGKQKGLTTGRDQPEVLAHPKPHLAYSKAGRPEQCQDVVLFCTGACQGLVVGYTSVEDSTRTSLGEAHFSHLPSLCQAGK